MEYNLKSSACTIIMLQEAKRELLEHLHAFGEEGVAEVSDGRGSEVNWKLRPTSAYIGFRGAEQGSSLLIAARRPIAQGVRLLLLRKGVGGTFKANKNKRARGSRSWPRRSTPW